MGRSQNPPLPVWGARLARKLKASGHTRKDIAHVLGYSESTIKAVLSHFRNHGEDRVPQQGQGKQDDPRWIFAGARKQIALHQLQKIKDDGDDADLLKEVHQTFIAAGAFSPEYRTLCNALQEHLNYTRKRTGVIPRERNIPRSNIWRYNTFMTYTPDQLVLVDESAATNRTMMRSMGYSRRGAIAKTNHYYFHKSKAHSVLGPFVLDDGFLDMSIIEGAFDGERFWEAMNQVVFPYLQPYPNPRSVLILDNCPIHKQARIADAVHKLGAILLFLEPYDPDSMPVEYAFRCMKNWLRVHGKGLTDCGVSLKMQLQMAMRAVGRGSSRHAFHAAGYL